MEFNLQRTRIDEISEARLFAEMERVWTLLGHRPSRTEWEAANPEISYITYRRRFGGWISACLQFVEYKMGEGIATDRAVPKPRERKLLPPVIRDVPPRLRLKVLDRDRFACILCGRSPALSAGIVLHVDHRVPFSQGGSTTLENLRTLCADCNLGKGDSPIGGLTTQ